jgi:glutamate-1-semialdehyde 2,1-aminomutase
MTRANSQDRALRERAAAVIPGGMYGHQAVGMLPDDYPQFFSKAQGARLWDADGNEMIDFMCAYGPNLLGYGHEGVNAAYTRQMNIADAMTGPSGLIVDLAEAFVGMVTHADWAMFCKNGTDATTMALVAARAHTRRKTILKAKGAYHGSAPWCTPRPSGTTPEDRAHQIHFTYNDIESFEAAVREAGDDLAGVFAAPVMHDAFVDQQMPDPAYARRVRELCDQTGALLIVDDVRSGLRVARDCSWSIVGVEPDLSTWGKCFANGHPISALLGNDKARKAASSIYVTGSFWFQAAPMAAALETLRIVREGNYLEHIQGLGERLRTGLAERAAVAGFGFRQTGPVTMPLFLFDDDPDLRKGFAWCSAMLERGVYTHPWHNMFLCDAMTEADIDFTLDAAEASFAVLKARAPTLEPVAKMAFLTA